MVPLAEESVCARKSASRNQEEVMTEIVQNGKAILRNRRRPSLTKDQIFRLWRAAVKDDDKFVDEIIQRVHDDMIAFDSQRIAT